MDTKKGPRYFKGDSTPYCRWCETKLDADDKLAMDTGYCSSQCYENSADGDDE